MSDKQKQPVQKDAPKDQQKLANKHGAKDGSERDSGAGLDQAEVHRQSGHRVSDQGTHKH
jgi:hypothetical protein